uniref:Energy transducer TonB n=1 Tax=Ascaris lumbricoides TaxID=6252 RepID=A0A0M3HVZ4_ASCLU
MTFPKNPVIPVEPIEVKKTEPPVEQKATEPQQEEKPSLGIKVIGELFVVYLLSDSY